MGFVKVGCETEPSNTTNGVIAGSTRQTWPSVELKRREN